MKLAAYALIGFGAYLFFQSDIALMGLGISWVVLGGLIFRYEPDTEPSESGEGPLTPA